MSEQIEKHQDAMISAFAEVLKAEDAISAAKSALTEATTRLDREVREAEFRREQAWSVVKGLLDSTGEYEVTLPGSVTDYKISYSTPRETVKAEVPEAVPDEFCKIERKPRLKEIGEFLKGLR